MSVLLAFHLAISQPDYKAWVSIPVLVSSLWALHRRLDKSDLAALPVLDKSFSMVLV